MVPEAMRLAVDDMERATERVRMAMRAQASAEADSEKDNDLVADTMTAVVEAASDVRDAANAVLRWALYKRGEARDG